MLAVPQFKELRFAQDKLGHPHLEALYAHHRPNAGWQSEEHFSDGTLGLLGLLGTLLNGNSLLLLEEPEISLNDAVVKDDSSDPATLATRQEIQTPDHFEHTQRGPSQQPRN